VIEEQQHDARIVASMHQPEIRQDMSAD
jgi:hypothetical protein